MFTCCGYAQAQVCKGFRYLLSTGGEVGLTCVESATLYHHTMACHMPLAQQNCLELIGFRVTLVELM